MNLKFTLKQANVSIQAMRSFAMFSKQVILDAIEDNNLLYFNAVVDNSTKQSFITAFIALWRDAEKLSASTNAKTVSFVRSELDKLERKEQHLANAASNVWFGRLWTIYQTNAIASNTISLKKVLALYIDQDREKAEERLKDLIAILCRKIATPDMVRRYFYAQDLQCLEKEEPSFRLWHFVTQATLKGFTTEELVGAWYEMVELKKKAVPCARAWMAVQLGQSLHIVLASVPLMDVDKYKSLYMELIRN
jgi:hypothetical protein